MVWINGINMGRYWEIGPQQTLYIPGCWLKKGNNEIIILDLKAHDQEVSVSGVQTPVLDQINLEVTLKNRKEGQNLNLTDEVPVKTGDLKNTKDWQEVTFDKVVNGRYFCFEATTPQREGDDYASMAEFQVLGENNQSLSRSEWKMMYADSEETVAGNHNADKVFDKQESTFWHTEWQSSKPDYPHQIVIDMGKNIKIKGFRCILRTDDINNGNIKGYRFYVKKEGFKF